MHSRSESSAVEPGQGRMGNIEIIDDPDSDLPIVFPYLFSRQRFCHGEVDGCLASIDIIEAPTGVDFFHELDGHQEGCLEYQDTWNFPQLHFMTD